MTKNERYRLQDCIEMLNDPTPEVCSIVKKTLQRLIDDFDYFLAKERNN